MTGPPACDRRARAGEVHVGPLIAGDWPRVAAVLAAGIATGDATFETVVPAWRDWDAAHLPAPRLAARAGGQLVGWAALSPVSGRCVYSGVAEDSVYVHPRWGRQAVGPLGPPGGWAAPARRTRRRVRAARDLDAAGRRLPGERRQSPAARVLRLPPRRDPRAARGPRRPLARRRAARATQPGRRSRLRQRRGIGCPAHLVLPRGAWRPMTHHRLRITATTLPRTVASLSGATAMGS